MRISNEHFEMMKNQISLDCNTAEAIEISPHIFLAPSKKLEGARIIDGLDPYFFRVVVFMGNAYVMADEETLPGWEELLKGDSADWFFNYGHLRKIDYILNEYDREIVDTHVFFLPDEDAKVIDEPANLKWYGPKEIEAMRETNVNKYALCYSPTQPDYIAVSAIDEITGQEMGMAGASIDGKYVSQIGIDVNPAFRNKHVAVPLVTILKQHIIKEGRLPFYGTNESHALSRSVGVKSGFLPAFSELYVAKKR